MAHVAILGGGVIGSLCAYYLIKAGQSVTIIERDQFGMGCSQGNCGYICPSHVLPLAAPGALGSTLKTLFQRNSALKVSPLYALSQLGWFLQFTKQCTEHAMHKNAEGIQLLLDESRKLYDELMATEEFSVEWDTSGLMFVYQTQKAFEHYGEINQLLSDRYQRPARRLDHHELLAFEPSLKPESVSGAYHYECDAQLRSDVFMRQLKQWLIKNKVNIIERQPVAHFQYNGNSVSAIQLKDQTIQADAVVIATGALTPEVLKPLGIQIPIIPGKGYSITIPRPENCPRVPMIFEEHRVAISPFQTGFRVGSTMEFRGYNTELDPKRLALLKAGAEMYLKTPGDYSKPEDQWWGWRPMIPDGKPVIDRAGKENLYVAAGHGMLGLSMATGTGKMITEMIVKNNTTLDASHYSVARFRKA